MITTKTISKQYGLSDRKVRQILRQANFGKDSNDRFWWIDDSRKEEIDQLFKKELGVEKTGEDEKH